MELLKQGEFWVLIAFVIEASLIRMKSTLLGRIQKNNTVLNLS